MEGYLPCLYLGFSLIGPVAQGLEQLAHNQLAVGSIPTRPTISKSDKN